MKWPSPIYSKEFRPWHICASAQDWSHQMLDCATLDVPRPLREVEWVKRVCVSKQMKEHIAGYPWVHWYGKKGVECVYIIHQWLNMTQRNQRFFGDNYFLRSSISPFFSCGPLDGFRTLRPTSFQTKGKFSSSMPNYGAWLLTKCTSSKWCLTKGWRLPSQCRKMKILVATQNGECHPGDGSILGEHPHGVSF